MSLVPSLLQAVPPFDGWRMPFQYASGPDGDVPNVSLGQVTAMHFIIYSFGQDMALGGGTDGSASAQDIQSAWDSNPQPTPIPGTQQTHCYQSDIVWGDSSFEQSPDGKQTKC